MHHAFKHTKIDPMDSDLFGLYWDGVYVDTSLPFGRRHGSLIFSRLVTPCATSCVIMALCAVHYIDDFNRVGMPEFTLNLSTVYIYQ